MTHQALLEQLNRLGWTEEQGMRALSDVLIISDNCVRVWDIAEPDLSRAVNWLKSKRIGWGDGVDINAKVLK